MRGNDTPAWVGVTYLIYWALIIVVFWGGVGYAVFVLGHHGGWFALPFGISMLGYSPWRWHSIYTGVEAPYSRFTAGQR